MSVAGSIAVVAVTALLAVLPSQAAAQAQDPTCSMQTAVAVAGPSNPFNPGVATPIGHVLCGAFAGPGSNAMLVTFTAATCWGLQAWAIYVHRDGSWQEALRVPDWITGPPAVLADGAIREISPVFSRYDSRCIPSGGERGRTWKWDGSRFAAGKWKQTQVHVILAAAVACQLRDDGTPTGSFAYCWTGGKRDRHARLGADGTLDTKTAVPPPQGIGGPNRAVGTVVTEGRLRCKVHRTNVTCWVRTTGKGMRFTAKGKATPVQIA